MYIKRLCKAKWTSGQSIGKGCIKKISIFPNALEARPIHVLSARARESFDMAIKRQGKKSSIYMRQDVTSNRLALRVGMA